MELNRLVQEKSPSIIFLMKTKSLVTQMEKIKGKIGASCCFTVGSIGRKGGLALLWFHGTEFEIVNYSNYHIYSKIIEDPKGLDWFLTRFHVMPETGRRSDSFHLLGKINQGINTGLVYPK